MISPATGHADQSPLAARFNTGPQLFAPDEAARRLDALFGDIVPDQARALRDIGARFPQAQLIMEGIAEASPYLFDLIRVNPARAVALMQCDPDVRLAALIETTAKGFCRRCH